ncbi:MAG TPA: wax ester/triacylglycerol synthase family O-acyltransferase [Actinomycetota bacterium]|nr:wax ester/triacylglycerol synthase family O-acyltransferase [Actinomycetota bacterium]
MERLTGLDAGFLYMETPTLHMHTLKISVVDPSSIPGGYSFQLFKDVLEDRLHLLPPFRRRIVEVPLRVHHPVWIEDPSFDLSHHVRRVGCPAPGGMHEFAELVSDIASRQLERHRPLWEIWVIEGLEDGNVAFVAKIHHSVADGIAAASLLANVAADLTGQPEAEEWRGEPVPGRWALFRDAAKDLGRELLGLPRLVRSTVRNMRAVRSKRADADIAPPLPFQTPKTRFNTSLTPHRTFTMSTLSLEDVKKVKNAFDATVNDVILAVVAGALRRYLTERSELPDRPLVAGVPVSTAADPERLGGNKVSNMFTALRTDLEDPIERLHAIHEVTKAAKEFHNVLGSEMLRDWSEITPPRPFAWFMRMYSRRELAARHRPPINLVVSNVPGPRTPLSIAGANIVALYSMGPILEGIGLNVTVWSYVDSINFGLVSCPEFAPDLWALTDALGDELAELVKRAEAA